MRLIKWSRVAVLVMSLLVSVYLVGRAAWMVRDLSLAVQAAHARITVLEQRLSGR